MSKVKCKAKCKNGTECYSNANAECDGYCKTHYKSKKNGVDLPKLNKGTGAGGSNTNKNGLPYEKMTDLDECFTLNEVSEFSQIITFENSDTKFIRTKQARLFKYMHNHIDKNINKAHGCKNPDECYIDLEKKNLFIIEKKFQQVSGSVCEKIQTSDFKIWQYSRTFPGFNIVYIYCLSEWFKSNCKAEIEYLKYKKTPVYWGNSISYKEDIVNFIVNYKL